MKKDQPPPSETSEQGAQTEPQPDRTPEYTSVEQFIRRPIDGKIFSGLLASYEEAGRTYDDALAIEEGENNPEASVLFTEAENALRSFILCYGAECFAEGRRRGIAAGLATDPTDAE